MSFIQALRNLIKVISTFEFYLKEYLLEINLIRKSYFKNGSSIFIEYKFVLLQDYRPEKQKIKNLLF